MGVRDENVDNAKRGATRTKADASAQYAMPPDRGGWAAPGHVHVVEMSPSADEYAEGQRWQPGGDNDADQDD